MINVNCIHHCRISLILPLHFILIGLFLYCQIDDDNHVWQSCLVKISIIRR